MTERFTKPVGEPDIGLEDDLQEPRQFRVLLHNDDYTTMDFVVRVLRTVFKKSPDEATRIMFKVHEEGVGVCGIYPAELAETKVTMVRVLARGEGFPLRSSMEEV